MKEEETVAVLESNNLSSINISKMKITQGLIFLLFSASINFGLKAQSTVPNNQDCIDAIPVCQSTYNQINSYSGTGNVPNEINDTMSCLLSGEKNDVWYTFTVQSSGMLNFSIFPKDTNDDYDWALFNLTNNSCSDIFSNASIQTSCNYCSNIGCQGVTGANGQQNGPCGAQDMPQVPVVAGQVYVLNVSNYSSSQHGYILDFSQSTAMIYDTTHPKLRTVSTLNCGGGDSISVEFSKNIVCSSVQTTDFSLTGPGGPYIVTVATSKACVMGLPYSRTYNIVVNPAVTLPGTYTFQLVGPVTDVCGNVALYPAGVSFNISPIQIVKDSIITHCNLNNADIIVQVSGGTPPLTYSWSPHISNGDTALGVAPGTYSLLISDNSHCQAKDSFVVKTGTPMTLWMNPSDTICNGQSVTLRAMVTGGSGVYTYSWDQGLIGKDTITVGPGASLTYSVFVTDANHCVAGPDSTRVIVMPMPTAFFAADTLSGCSPVKAFFQAATAGNTGCVYRWLFGDGDSANTAAVNHVYATPGCETVTLTVTAPGGHCFAVKTDSCLIHVYPSPVANFIANTYSTDILSPSFQFEDQSTSADTWYWNFGDGGSSITENPNHDYTVSGQYPVWLVVKNSDGCTDSVMKTVVVNDLSALYIPNSFTPNGDGRNDYFGPVGFQIDGDDYQMLIYDRWGNLIYTTSDLNKPWNGTMNNTGQEAPMGEYVYYIRYRDIDKHWKEYAGGLSLIR